MPILRMPADASVHRFNRACRWISLAWLTTLILGSQLLRPTYQDLSGIYVGGLIARLGAWDALYPVPDPNSPYYVGQTGVEKPQLVAIADRYYVRQLTPYLQPPWQAVLFYPMGCLPFEAAHWAWLALLVACTWGVALQAGETFNRCAARPSRTAGVLTLLVATSLLAYRSIRVQNMSPIMALAIGTICLGFVSPATGPSSLISAFAVVAGAVMKIATVALLPLAVALRRWRLILLSACLGVAFVALTFALAGRQTFHEFFSQIAPTLGRSAIGPGNKSLQAFLIRLRDGRPLDATALLAFRGVQWTSLLVTLLAVLRPRVSWTPPRVFAASAALVAWLLVFSPLCWEHYFLYLCPLWGWLMWEAGQGGILRRATAIGAIALHWAALPPFWRGAPVPEPLNSLPLLGLIAMLALAWARLTVTDTPPQATPVAAPPAS